MTATSLFRLLSAGLTPLFFLLTTAGCGRPVTHSPSKHVAILQLGTHEVIDAITTGIRGRLSERAPGLRVTTLNGQFDKQNLLEHSLSLLSSDADVVITVSTPATMAFLSVNNGKKQLVFTFVTEPRQLGYTGLGSLPNVTGLSNQTDYAGTLQLVTDILPAAPAPRISC